MKDLVVSRKTEADCVQGLRYGIGGAVLRSCVTCSAFGFAHFALDFAARV